MVENKFSTFSITIRPRKGVTTNDIDRVGKYIRKIGEYYKIVTEKEGGACHLHIALLTKTPKSRTWMTVSINRLFPQLDRDEKSVLNKGIKIWYSDDWLKYLAKGDNTVVIADNLPEAGYLEKYYPPKAEPSKQRSAYMVATVEQYLMWWREFLPTHYEINTKTCRDFIVALQHKHKKIGLLTDTQIIQRAKWMTRHYHESDTYMQDLPAFEVEEPNRNM